MDHTFEGGTVIPANSTYYVVADVAQFKLRTTGPTGGQRLLIQGNFEGQLQQLWRVVAAKQGGATIASTSYGVQPLAGDFDSSGTVDDLDYEVWQTTFGSTTDLRADANANGGVDAGDYTVWRDNLGAIVGGGGSDIRLAAREPLLSEFETATDAEVFNFPVNSWVGELSVSTHSSQNAAANFGRLHLLPSSAAEVAVLAILTDRLQDKVGRSSASSNVATAISKPWK